MPIGGWFWTANSIINTVALECGLLESNDPWGSTDVNFKRLRGCLQTTGLELNTTRLWTHLVKEHTITTAALDTGGYDLPDDFRCMVDQSHWERTTQEPMDPLSSQEWQFLEALGTTDPITISFREREHQFWVYPNPPDAGLELAFEYASRYWVASDGSTSADKALPTAGNDVILFDPLLVCRALKYHFLAQNGMDTGKARADYEYALANLSDSAAPVLTLARAARSHPWALGPNGAIFS